MSTFHASLVLVPTPIGNLDDITLRALKVLAEVDAVIAEDTRVTGRLLQHYAIARPQIGFHAHNEHRMVEQLVQRMQNGERFAMVTDAGTPGISDPGFLLVRAALAAGVTVECLPGATAFVPALVNSGLPCDRFVFEGFLPVKKGRRTRLDALRIETRTMVFYESPHRIGRHWATSRKGSVPTAQQASPKGSPNCTRKPFEAVLRNWQPTSPPRSIAVNSLWWLRERSNG